jgi:hypothetical protein
MAGTRNYDFLVREPPAAPLTDTPFLNPKEEEEEQ